MVPPSDVLKPPLSVRAVTGGMGSAAIGGDDEENDYGERTRNVINRRTGSVFAFVSAASCHGPSWWPIPVTAITGLISRTGCIPLNSLVVVVVGAVVALRQETVRLFGLAAQSVDILAPEPRPSARRSLHSSLAR